MTRKKFIKLLMSAEVQRNEANEIARMYQRAGYSYVEAILHVIQRVIEAMEEVNEDAEREV